MTTTFFVNYLLCAHEKGWCWWWWTFSYRTKMVFVILTCDAQTSLLMCAHKLTVRITSSCILFRKIGPLRICLLMFNMLKHDDDAPLPKRKRQNKDCSTNCFLASLSVVTRLTQKEFYHSHTKYIYDNKYVRLCDFWEILFLSTARLRSLNTIYLFMISFINV